MDKVQTTLYPESTFGNEHLANEPTWVLGELEVFNWGPFSGFHRAEFDPAGTAIIGPTGSGKTTLVDALMTLLVSKPKYNLASTGGHESDRTLISYVRGVLGGDGTDGREQVVRPGKTITGVCATYRWGEESLRLAGLMWTDGNSRAAGDLKRRWIFSQAKDQTLESWLRLLHEESSRELKRVGRETAQLRIFDSKKAYLAHSRKFFGVGENAFTLLNRAAGLKQLNSIDEIFRELVLDDRTAFDRALEVASEFDNLAGIHAELETARRQQASLEPVAAEFRKLENARARLANQQELKQIIPVWFALAGQKIWTAKLGQVEHDRQEKQTELIQLQQQASSLKSHVDTLRESYLKLGGNAIGDLETSIKLCDENVGERRRHASEYLQMVQGFSLDEALTEVALQKNQAILSERLPSIHASHAEAERETLDVKSRQRDAENQAATVKAELQKVSNRPGSNIPSKFHDFRSELAGELSLKESELPFLAELVEVTPDQANWRGAIERAIGSERLRILVPDRNLKAALRWVNNRNNRLHVRLQSASKQVNPQEGFDDGFVRKLNFKPHPFVNVAKVMLARLDRHCVDSSDDLQNVEHGMTVQGMMSGRRGKFEKQDQRRLNENWMTGFDNKDQLESLELQHTELSESIREATAKCNECFSKQKTLGHQITAIEQLSKLEFATIDLNGAQLQLADLKKRLKSLLDPESDASQAKIAFESEAEKLERLNSAINELAGGIATLKERHSQTSQQLEWTVQRIGKGLNAEQELLANKQMPIPDDIEAASLDAAEREATATFDDKLKKQTEKVVDHEKRLVRSMVKAKGEDTGALVDVGSELDDVPAYLEQLRVLNEEALPEKRKRFIKYLNESSDQGVTQLLAGIQEEVDMIEQRIYDLNRTLSKVDFRSGRYLQLQPQRIKHERLRSLEAAMRKLRNAALKDDEGASHYRALQAVVAILHEAGDNRRQQGSRALLDPRYRLEFYVVEVDRQTGKQSPKRTGSQGGSGGEKELMASHILTASLSYALCPTESSRPLYGSVVLDEAFSKSSPSAATRIIEALGIFGLHPIFVTPNKEIGLLKRHTRKVICVQRPKTNASVASISWEKLEDLARLR
jgi:uncharacterized protein YPO0396